jgi:hypothetical protein
LGKTRGVGWVLTVRERSYDRTPATSQQAA